MVRRLRERIKKFWAAVALLSVEMLIVLALFTGALALFVYMVRRVFYLHNNAFDEKVFTYLSTHVNPRNNEIMQAFTFLGTHKFLIPANLVLIAYFLFIRRHRWYSIKVPAIALSSLALMFGLKFVFERPRPLTPLLEEARGLSFPSGHALMSVTFYGLLVYIVWHSIKQKGLKWTLIALLLLLILVIGFTRIYLRVHYASDVVAGFCVGLLWLVICVWTLNQLEKYSKRNLNALVQEPALPQKVK
ncbi:phosphatase PAP2 family protein [Paraflavisolibacter sp. H34]|uniref:phosphatase PAP2 family protein n=1 Tax=Huijunlia imazamoxiresistens TaxID=3127457 RepID=UPI00301661E4